MKNLQNFEIYIDANGKWFHQGKSIDRVSIVKLFSTILKRDRFGEYWLENPVEKGKIIVEDAPFVIVNFEQKKIKTKNYIFFIDNIDRRHLLSIKFPIVFYKDKSKKFNKPYISLQNGLFAKILSSVYYELVKFSEENNKKKRGVWSDGCFFELE